MLTLLSGPGGTPLPGAGHYLPALAQDTGLARVHPVDSVVVNPQFGDPITPIIQFLFQQPPWVMWGGLVLALVLLFFIIRWAWPRRHAFFNWVGTRSRGLKAAMLAGVGIVVLTAAGLGYKSYEFVETDKRFCNGCHIFVPSGQAWVLPDTGNYTLVPQMEGKHDSLSCHTCHPLKPVKEAVKLVFWMSGARDEEIPEHAKVPRTLCEDCHVQGEAKETWQAIAATAGHRTHLESDSTSLKDVECLTCHARTAHRFPPVSETCGQSGCHEESQTRIVLGKMTRVAGDVHCTACHNFVATVPRLATRDSAAATLSPALQQCFKCHEMKERLPDFDAARDPHDGGCGMCHDPHKQKMPEEARETCVTAACHAGWRDIPFHVGANHRRQAQNCVTCHQPHAARVDASDCTGCHTRARIDTGGRLAPPLPFDTLKALKQSWSPVPVPPPAGLEPESKVKGDAPPLVDPPPPPRPEAGISALPSDTFEHTRHKKLTCLTCHVNTSGRTGLTFEAPRGCQICHHQQPAGSDCVSCHAAGTIPSALTMTVPVAAANKPPRPRPVEFRHETHGSLGCVACHSSSVALALADSAASCAACHADHHKPESDCASCHRPVAPTPEHARPAEVHQSCDACHTTSRISGLQPTRSFCLACHESAVDHYGPKECSDCHFLASPDEYRRHLLRGGGKG